MTKLTLNHFDKIKAGEAEIDIKQLIDIAGVKVAIQYLRCLPKNRKDDIINFTADCAESVLHGFESQYPEDDRPRKAIEAARNYKNLTKEKISKVVKAAYAAANGSYTNAINNTATYAASAAASAAAHAVSAANADNYNTYTYTYSTNASVAAYARNSNDVSIIARAEAREKQAKLLLKYFA